MYVYLAAPMLGDRSALNFVRLLAKTLEEKGYHVITPHVIEEVLDVERGLTPREIFERDVKLMEEADVLVAEVSYPSLGVGFEIAYCLMLGKPVIALCSRERLEKTSALIRGISLPNFRLIAYIDPVDGIESLLEELKSIKVRAHGRSE